MCILNKAFAVPFIGTVVEGIFQRISRQFRWANCQGARTGRVSTQTYGL